MSFTYTKNTPEIILEIKNNIYINYFEEKKKDWRCQGLYKTFVQKIMTYKDT